MSAPTRLRPAFAAVVTLTLVGGLTACSDDQQPGAKQASSVADSPTPTPTPEPPGPAEQLGLREGWGPSEAQLDRATREVAKLKLPHLAGQVIVASYSGTGAPVALVNTLHLGGVIAFTNNVTSPAQLKQVNRRLQRASKRRWPLFLGVDQEGGIVERIKGDVTRYPAFMSAGAARNPRLTTTAYQALGRELASLGVNVDFAPDADVTTGAADPTIGSRSPSGRPELAATTALAAAQGLESVGVLPTLKHFPGHGSVRVDSHQSLPVLTRSRKQLREIDLVPFKRAIEAGLPAILTGHLAVKAYDPGVPASLSRKVTTDLLRQRLGFNGLVVTDALEMGAVGNRSSGQAAVQALRAGADVLLMPRDPVAARQGIIDAVRRGQLPRKRVEQAAARQIALLRHLATQRKPSQPGSARAASYRLSKAAVTMVAGPCRGPVKVSRLVPIGDPVAVANFKAAAARSGLVLGRRLEIPQPPRRVVTFVKVGKPGKKKRKKVVTFVPRPPLVRIDGNRMDLIGYGGGAPAGSVVVATDTPYVLGRTNAPVRIATYGNTPGAMRALVEVLQGKSRATGRLPVRVSGVPRTGCS